MLNQSLTCLFCSYVQGKIHRHAVKITHALRVSWLKIVFSVLTNLLYHINKRRIRLRQKQFWPLLNWIQSKIPPWKHQARKNFHLVTHPRTTLGKSTTVLYCVLFFHDTNRVNQLHTKILCYAVIFCIMESYTRIFVEQKSFL